MSQIEFRKARHLDETTRNELESIKFSFAGQQSGGFAIATAKRLNLPLVLFVDNDNDPLHAACNAGDGVFFDAGGPFSLPEFWQKVRIPVKVVTARQEAVTSLLDVTESDIVVSEAALDRLLEILAEKTYH